MNDIQKFQADIKRIIKHDRADNGGVYDGVRASKTIAELFISSNKDFLIKILFVFRTSKAIQKFYYIFF